MQTFFEWSKIPLSTYLAVKALGQSMLTGAWNNSAHTSQYVLNRENLWSGLGDVFLVKERYKLKPFSIYVWVSWHTFISYPAGLSHSNKKMVSADSCTAAKTMISQEAASKGSAKGKVNLFETRGSRSERLA